MRFKKLEEYDKNIKDLNNKLLKFKTYVDDHPEKIGVQGNYKLIESVRDDLIEERKLFIDS